MENMIPKKIGKDKVGYRTIQYEKGGWVNAKKFLPEDFDLVYMKIRGKKDITGWANGYKWEGLRLKDDDEILYWKRKPEQKD
jgi:hypothetical protein